MARPMRALLLPLLLMLLSLGVTLARESSGDVPAAASMGWDLGAVVGAGEDEEFGFSGTGDSVARRVLQSGGYISYGALRRDSVPCSARGASYYNCRPGGQANPYSRGWQANPYSRGCSAITRCRG